MSKKHLQLRKLAPFFVSFFGGILLFLAWYPNGTTVLIFLALIPFFYLSSSKTFHPLNLFTSLFFGFFLFHLLAAWWMYSSTIAGSLMAHVFNAGYMAIVFLTWAYVHRFIASKTLQLLVIISFWLSFEYLHHHWELAWPWFTLGHVFAAETTWIQWYRITGSLGGSAWILTVNGILYLGFVSLLERKYINSLLLTSLAVSVVFIPIVISGQMKSGSYSETNFLNVLIVQPNIHPQKEKFAGMSPAQQLERAIKLMQKDINVNTDLVVFPETMLIESINEKNPESNAFIQTLRNSMPQNRDVAIFTGAFTKKTEDWAIADSKALITDSIPFVLYNSALLITKESISIYHKNRLVPLVEKQPFHRMMLPIREFIEEAGGFFGSYGTFNERRNFQLNDSVILSPLICFESAFGNYSAGAAMNSGFIVLITNDGWWSSSGGYKQHLQLARLRAIETGRWVVRCANTGVSSVIDARGNIQIATTYMNEETISYKIPIINKSTFYSLHHKKMEILPLLLSLLFGGLVGFRNFWAKRIK